VQISWPFLSYDSDHILKVAFSQNAPRERGLQLLGETGDNGDGAAAQELKWEVGEFINNKRSGSVDEEKPVAGRRVGDRETHSKFRTRAGTFGRGMGSVFGRG